MDSLHCDMCKGKAPENQNHVSRRDVKRCPTGRERKKNRKLKHIKAITADYSNGGHSKHINGIMHGQ